jgi:hypothetical protein
VAVVFKSILTFAGGNGIFATSQQLSDREYPLQVKSFACSVTKSALSDPAESFAAEARNLNKDFEELKCPRYLRTFSESYCRKWSGNFGYSNRRSRLW